ncbi:hypothetical protein BCR34DRAFT_592248 [Clohesyomyces aquaticus]|uniref:Uncharacterized protein n=1 Tax=Clohesyomyces aquaticus TaxID=1231657 RepID=A0A1Y1YTW5_9PLEO|nr:hypothetical protein BCR34DRAFT_592248 [Clohesyomyces aquaticus]
MFGFGSKKPQLDKRQSGKAVGKLVGKPDGERRLARNSVGPSTTQGSIATPSTIGLRAQSESPQAEIRRTSSARLAYHADEPATPLPLSRQGGGSSDQSPHALLIRPSVDPPSPGATHVRAGRDEAKTEVSEPQLLNSASQSRAQGSDAESPRLRRAAHEHSQETEIERLRADNVMIRNFYAEESARSQAQEAEVKRIRSLLDAEVYRRTRGEAQANELRRNLEKERKDLQEEATNFRALASQFQDDSKRVKSELSAEFAARSRYQEEIEKLRSQLDNTQKLMDAREKDQRALQVRSQDEIDRLHTELSAQAATRSRFQAESEKVQGLLESAKDAFDAQEMQYKKTIRDLKDERNHYFSELNIEGTSRTKAENDIKRLRAASKTAEDAFAAKETEFLKLSSQIRNELAAALAAKEDAERGHKAAVREYNVLEQQNILLQEKVEEAQEFLETQDRVRQDNKALRVEVTRLVKEVENGRKSKNLENEAPPTDLLPSNGLYYRVDEQWICQHWDDLNTSIISLALDCNDARGLFHGDSPPAKNAERRDTMDDFPPREVLALTQNVSKYLDSPLQRAKILQALIWNELNHQVFDHVSRYSKGLYWAGGLRHSLARLKADLRPLRRHKLILSDAEKAKEIEDRANGYQRWRAATSTLLLATMPVDERILKSEVDRLVEIIVKIIGSIRNDLPTRLRSIIEAAIRFDGVIQQQVPFYYVEQWTHKKIQGNPHWGFPLNDEEMKVVAEDGARQKYTNPAVDLILQPALFKEGNIHGDNYYLRRVLCKAKVICREDPAPIYKGHWRANSMASSAVSSIDDF